MVNMIRLTISMRFINAGHTKTALLLRGYLRTLVYRILACSDNIPSAQRMASSSLHAPLLADFGCYGASGAGL